MNIEQMSRAEINLGAWLKEYRMANHFPDLSVAPALRVADEFDKVFLRRDGEEITSVLNRVRHAKRTLVRFTPGHGTTTFAQSVAKQGRDFGNGIYLFVEPFRKRNLLGGHHDDFMHSGTARVLSEALLEALIDRNFEDLLYNGRALYFDILNVGDESNLHYYRNCKLKGEEPTDYKDWFEGTAERLSGRFLDTIEKLHSDANMSTIVCIDLPHTSDEDLIGEIVRSMKWVDEQKRPGFPNMALLETYFVSHAIANTITSIWSANYQELTIDPYNPEDIFLILSRRYNPTRLGHTVPLNTILGEEFLDVAYDKDKPLNVILKRMRAALLKACERPREQIRPALAP
jgi:hypothetical protein